MGRKKRHVLGLSGGKDSTALAVHLHRRAPDLEYFFCDTGKELPETYEYLDRIRARLGIEIQYLSAKRGFDHWLQVYGGFLPSARMRWCTKQLKIIPFEKFVGDDETVSYIAIRADEDRDGYISRKSNITPVFPFKEEGIRKGDVFRILEESGIGLPEYYRWRTRSGCFFCFFQRKYEWVRLAEEHPERFQDAVDYEQEHEDGRQFFWNQDESLLDLLARRDEIVDDHRSAMEQHPSHGSDGTLLSALDAVLEADDENAPCLMCAL